MNIFGKLRMEKRPVPDDDCGVRLHKKYRLVGQGIVQLPGVFNVISSYTNDFHFGWSFKLRGAKIDFWGM
jgi:hypothetical protein